MNHFDDDVELNDTSCPKCGTSPTNWQRCWHCDDGFIDVYEEDPLWYDEGDYEVCSECLGHGCHSWCPNCGWDLLQKHYLNCASEAQAE